MYLVTLMLQVAGGSVTKVSHLLVTPRVRREVRAHFGCRGAQGGELEDQVRSALVRNTSELQS